MSQMEYNKGTLREVSWEYITRLYEDADPDDLPYTTEEMFERIGGKYYEVEFLVRRGDLENDFCNLDVRCYGEIDFETYHYNGGAHWTEIVGDEIKRRGLK